MTEERRLRILTMLVGSSGAEIAVNRICVVCAEVMQLSGAGVMLIDGDTSSHTACASNEISNVIDNIQIEFGEGPSLDAYRERRPVLEKDLVVTGAQRWVAFSQTAAEAGVRAIFAFPLRIGAVRIGAFHVYRDTPGFLTNDQHADALLLADVIAHTLIMMQANAPHGRLAAELEANLGFQYIVHQASGMVAAQLKIDVREALVRLQASAFGNERSLLEVAGDVVERRMRFAD